MCRRGSDLVLGVRVRRVGGLRGVAGLFVFMWFVGCVGWGCNFVREGMEV